VTASYPGSIKSFTSRTDYVHRIGASDINSLQDEITAIETELGTNPAQGWTLAQDTWAYASATSFTISGVDRTAIFTKGTKLRLTQTTAKYFYVVSSSFSTNTTVNVTGGSDYTLANAAITLPYYSYASSPQGFPNWFNWAPSFTGFSANPTNSVYRFQMIGNTVALAVRQGTAGTSNATSFKVSLPITAQTITDGGWWGSSGFYVDNGGATTTGGAVGIATGDTDITCYTANLGAWTASGTKRTAFEIFYEI